MRVPEFPLTHHRESNPYKLPVLMTDVMALCVHRNHQVEYYSHSFPLVVCRLYCKI